MTPNDVFPLAETEVMKISIVFDDAIKFEDFFLAMQCSMHRSTMLAARTHPRLDNIMRLNEIEIH